MTANTRYPAEEPAPWFRTFEPKGLQVVTLVVVLAGFGWLAAFRGRPTQLQIDRADSTADWLAARAMVEGIDPYQDLYALADHFGVVYDNPVERGDADIAHPRLPGAILLLVPLAATDPGAALVWVLIASLVAVAVASTLLAAEFRFSYFAVASVCAFSILSGPARWSFLYGAQSHILLLAMAVFVVATLTDRHLAAGIALGVAATLKLFPLLLVLVLLRWKRYKSIVACCIFMLIINAAPLFADNVGLASAWTALSDASRNWSWLSANMSLGATLQRHMPIGDQGVWVLQIALLCWVSLMVWFRRLAMVNALVLAICVALLVSPLSWPHYLLLAVPIIATGLHLFTPIGWAKFTMATGIAMTTFVYRPELLTIGLVLIGVAASYGEFRPRRQKTLDHSEQGPPRLSLDSPPA